MNDLFLLSFLYVNEFKKFFLLIPLTLVFIHNTSHHFLYVAILHKKLLRDEI